MIPITIVFMGFVNLQTSLFGAPHWKTFSPALKGKSKWGDFGWFEAGKLTSITADFPRNRHSYIIYHYPICFMDETACVSMVFPSKPPFLGFFFRMYFPIARHHNIPLGSELSTSRMRSCGLCPSSLHFLMVKPPLVGGKTMLNSG